MVISLTWQATAPNVMNCKTIAVLLTCHNRKDKTLESLGSLCSQDLSSDLSLVVYLIDDGSTDGTSEAIAATYPQVKIFRGNGSLFWNGGMRLAFTQAMKDNPDYYLWLNDDTVLYPSALQTLLITHEKLTAQQQEKAIITGSTQDPDSQEWTYGGYRQLGWFYPPFKCKKVLPESEPQPCDLMCGNFVLIPKSVVEVVGNLDPDLTHYAGDWDYGLRAKQKGCSVWVAPGYQGTCARNPKPAPGSTPTLQKGLKNINCPKGLALESVTLQPWEEWKLLMKRHGGMLWPIYSVLPYRKFLLSSVFKSNKK